jgi:hypothetical protein
VQAGPPDYGNLPLVVISSALAGPKRLDADARVARMSTRGRHVLAAESGHWVPLDAPEVVVDAIVRLLGEIRTTTQAR